MGRWRPDARSYDEPNSARLSTQPGANRCRTSCTRTPLLARLPDSVAEQLGHLVQYDHGVGVPDEPAVVMPDDVSPGGNVRWLAPECLGGIGIERGVPGLAHARRQSQPRTRPHDDS